MTKPGAQWRRFSVCRYEQSNRFRALRHRPRRIHPGRRVVDFFNFMKPIETEFKLLALTFNREGFAYQQIWRQKDVAVYQYGPGRYELVIIRIQETHPLPGGKLLPCREAYPASSQWGQYGWTLGPKDRELAIHIAEQIVDLPPKDRIPKIHAIMDHWIATRASLQSVKPQPV